MSNKSFLESGQGIWYILNLLLKASSTVC